MADKIYNKVKDYIEKYHMIEPGDLIAAGISGGADSVCLLHLMWRLSQEIPFRLLAVHVNHGVRADAAEDAAYVERLCEDLAVPFCLREADMNGYATEHKLSPEEAGRLLRYRAFEEALWQQGRDGERGKIAVAHNAEDRAETMLFHLFRGSGVRGLASIQPVREMVIRPILCLERSEIEDYLAGYGLEYCRDSTNDTDAYTRNKIRHHILSYARQEICSASVAHMGELADMLMETERYLTAQAEQIYKACVEEAIPEGFGKEIYKEKKEKEIKEPGKKEEGIEDTDKEEKGIKGSEKKRTRIEDTDKEEKEIKEPEKKEEGIKDTGKEETKTGKQECPGLKIQISRLLTQDPVMYQRVLLMCMDKLVPHRKDITGQHIADLVRLAGRDGSKELSLPHGVRAYKEYDTLILYKNTGKSIRNTGNIAKCAVQDKGDDTADQGYVVEPPMEINVPGEGTYIFSILENNGLAGEKQQNIPQNRYTKWFDYDKITTVMLLRRRRQGDYLTIDTALHTKSVKQYMINEKIPMLQRDRMHILADGPHVLWIPGYRISERYKVEKSTKRILQVQLRGGRHGRTN